MNTSEANKLPNNKEGRFYTTADCDGCAYCALVAPDNFEYDKPTNTYFVSRQPMTKEEEEFVQEAMEECPVDAIRSIDLNGRKEDESSGVQHGEERH